MKIFISYSHDDKKYVDNKNPHSILKFIRGLEKEINVEFWLDERITTGDLWDAEIRKNIKDSQMAICLISQSFIDSSYISKIEIRKFLEKRKKEGMKIYPIILSACDWSKYKWLKQTQYIPKNNRNIELHYRNEGKRKELYATIRKEIKNILLNMNRKQGLDKHISVPIKIIFSKAEKLTLEIADKYIDTGDYVTAKNLFLGGLKFEDIPFKEQINVLIIEQKYGLISKAQDHLTYLCKNNLSKIPKEQIALLDLVRLKIQSQSYNHKKVISIFPKVLKSLNDIKQEIRAISVFNRTGIAYAVLGHLDESKNCLQKGFEISKNYKEPHMEITSKMYQSIAQFFCGVECDIVNPIEQIVKCQLLYFKNPINKKNIILWQAYNFKSIVQCLFAEAAMLLVDGKKEQSYIRLTSANLFSSIARSSPQAEGYAELLSVIKQEGIRDIVETAMYPDEKHKDIFQMRITSISSYLKQLQKVVTPLYHSPDLNKWRKLRIFFNKFDKRSF